MRKAIFSSIAAVALLAATPAAADAAKGVKGVPYAGKTAGGHKVSFRLDRRHARDFATGVPMSCLAIQGGGMPLTGVEVVTFERLKVGIEDFEHSARLKPSFGYNEVTRNHRITLRRAGRQVIKGALRVQYSFLIPKYPIGTFTIYSCLGSTKFRAAPAPAGRKPKGGAR